MKKSVLFFCLIFFTQLSFAQLIEVSDSTEISILTCSPGEEVYQRFGHTAIRYQDYIGNADMVFNYGIFNFNQPHFYLKFIKGETYYMLGTYDTKYFLEDYSSRGINVIEQKLNLTKEEKQQMLDVLMVNWLPENRHYLYNFVFDNCATKPRDRVFYLLQDKRFKYSYPSQDLTFRQWVGRYTGEDTWLKFGIDLLFGKDADEKATKWESMFLPDNLMNELKGTIILSDSTDNSQQKIVKEETVLIPSDKKITDKTPTYLKPIFVTGFIFVIVLIWTIVGLVSKRRFRLIDSILFSITGVAGIMLFYLMFFSIHPLVMLNFNILWCNPFNLILAFLIWFRRLEDANRFFAIINIFLQTSVILVWILGYQSINISFIPLILALLTRSIFWTFIKKQPRRRSNRRYR